MSISAGRFGSDGRFAQRKPAAGRRGGARFMVLLQCHSCGYQPDDDAVVPPRVCPKCNGSTWERTPRPRSLLEWAEDDQS